MWIRTRYALCARTDLPTLLGGGEAYGAPFLVERAREDRPLAWIALEPGTADDPVALGNDLAESLNRAVGGNLFPRALPLEYQLQALRRHRSSLGPLRLVVSGAELAPRVAARVAALHTPDLAVWLLTVDDDVELPAAHRVGAAQLRLTLDEAAELSPRHVGDGEIEELHRRTDGAYTEFIAALHRRAGLPTITVPAPTGRRFPADAAPLEDPRDVLVALERLGRWTDALEIAAEHLPERVEGLLDRAGPAFQARGLLPRLHLLLSLLPASHRCGERTLEWRLLAAHRVGESATVQSEVEAHLARHPAPDLRARHAALLPAEEREPEARRAAESAATPLTLWQYGRLHRDHAAGIALLRRSLEAAERTGDPYAAARAAGTLADRHTHAGDFADAVAWARWGLRIFDRNDLTDGPRRLRLVNASVFARLMRGDTLDLERELLDGLAALEGTLPDLARVYRSTLADVRLARGDVDGALAATRTNFAASPRHLLPRYAAQRVRALLEVGSIDDAQRCATDAWTLAGTARTQSSHPDLARGMVAAVRDPASAGALLAPLAHDTEARFEDRARAALHLLLADPEIGLALPSQLVRSVAALPEAALRVLSGPERAFRPVWRGLHTEASPPLELSVLGRPEARLEGERIELSLRRWEALVAIALHPDGIAYDALHAWLLRDQPGYSPATLRSHVSHLRERLPISDTPYRITVRYRLDLLDAQHHLRAGRVREAAALTRGPTLPASDAPGIREVRERYASALREALLRGGDAETLYALASRWSDDLEVWQAALRSLPENDPRAPLAAARVRRLEREYG